MENLRKGENIKCYEIEIEEYKDGSRNSKLETVHYYKNGRVKSINNYEYNTNEHFENKYTRYGIVKENQIESIDFYTNEDKVEVLSGISNSNLGDFDVLKSYKYRDAKACCVFNDLSKDMVEGRECFVIGIGDDIKFWIDEETKLVLKVIEKFRTVERTTYYKWEANVVTDDDIKVFEITGTESPISTMWYFLEKYEELEDITISDKYKEAFENWKRYKEKLDTDMAKRNNFWIWWIDFGFRKILAKSSKI